MPPGPAVSAASPADRPAACRALFAHLPDADRDRRADRALVRFASAADPPAAFADTLMATYDGTLDCPELNGDRTAAEVLAGHRAAAADPPDWALARSGPDPVGVVLLGPGPRPGVLEL